MGNTHTNPSAHGIAVTGTGESRTRPALTRRRYWKNKFGSQASGASRADGCQRWPDRGGAGITLRVQPREPCFHPPHFGTGLDAVGPAFSGRDRVRDTATHLMRTRYLRIAAKRAHPTFPRGRLSPGLPGIRPPAQVRSARLPVWREVMATSMRQVAGAGENSPSHSTPPPYPSGLTGGPIRLSTSHRPPGQAGGQAEGGSARLSPSPSPGADAPTSPPGGRGDFAHSLAFSVPPDLIRGPLALAVGHRAGRSRRALSARCGKQPRE